MADRNYHGYERHVDMLLDPIWLQITHGAFRRLCRWATECGTEFSGNAADGKRKQGSRHPAAAPDLVSNADA